KKTARSRAVELLKQVGIPRPEQIIDEYPHQLSGGMRQRVMIAIAIALHPKLLIADEPTTALDVTVQAQILELMKEIQEWDNMAILLITHDLGVVAEMADRVVVMYAGQVIESAYVNELFINPQHPYTQSLLNSIPRPEEEVDKLDTIRGVVPAIDQLRAIGCRFRDRCPTAFDDCKQVSPQHAQLAQVHLARCLLCKQCYPQDALHKHNKVSS